MTNSNPTSCSISVKKPKQYSQRTSEVIQIVEGIRGSPSLPLTLDSRLSIFFGFVPRYVWTLESYVLCRMISSTVKCAIYRQSGVEDVDIVSPLKINDLWSQLYHYWDCGLMKVQVQVRQAWRNLAGVRHVPARWLLQQVLNCGYPRPKEVDILLYTMIWFFNHGTQDSYPPPPLSDGNGEATVLCAPVAIWKRALGNVMILNPECLAYI